MQALRRLPDRPAAFVQSRRRAAAMPVGERLSLCRDQSTLACCGRWSHQVFHFAKHPLRLDTQVLACLHGMELKGGSTYEQRQAHKVLVAAAATTPRKSLGPQVDLRKTEWKTSQCSSDARHPCEHASVRMYLSSVSAKCMLNMHTKAQATLCVRANVLRVRPGHCKCLCCALATFPRAPPLVAPAIGGLGAQR